MTVLVANDTPPARQARFVGSQAVMVPRHVRRAGRDVPLARARVVKCTRIPWDRHPRPLRQPQRFVYDSTRAVAAQDGSRRLLSSLQTVQWINKLVEFSRHLHTRPRDPEVPARIGWSISTVRSKKLWKSPGGRSSQQFGSGRRIKGTVRSRWLSWSRSAIHGGKAGGSTPRIPNARSRILLGSMLATGSLSSPNNVMVMTIGSASGITSGRTCTRMVGGSSPDAPGSPPPPPPPPGSPPPAPPPPGSPPSGPPPPGGGPPPGSPGGQPVGVGPVK